VGVAENWFDEYQDNKVLRGGSWFSDKLNAHCSLRPRYYPGDRLNYLAFGSLYVKCLNERGFVDFSVFYRSAVRGGLILQ
jgi:hypothetical protein